MASQLVKMTKHERSPESVGAFAALVGGLVAVGVVLFKAAGIPRLPAHGPAWSSIWFGLEGADVPLRLVIAIVSTAAWLVWLWLVGCIVLRIALVVVEHLTDGRWVKRLRAVSDRVTPPIVSRLVEATLVALFLLNTGRGVAPAFAAGSNVAAVVALNAASQQQAVAASSDAAPAADDQPVEYTVQPNDTLWSIAEHFYGTGLEYPRLVAANAGRDMGHGQQFTRAGVIDAGWKLRVPLPSAALQPASGHIEYVVEEGDTLEGIAARLLGDPNRWQEIFDLNHGTAKLDEQRVLTQPGLIWPGLHLALPSLPAEGRAQPAPPLPAPSPSPLAAPPLSAAPAPISPPASSSADSAPETLPPIPVGGGPERSNSGDHVSNPPSPVLFGASGAAVLTALGGAAAFRRRRKFRRSLHEPPPDRSTALPIAVQDGFAESEVNRTLRHRMLGEDSELATEVVAHLDRLLVSRGLEAAAVLAAESRSSVEVTVRADLAARHQLPELLAQLDDDSACDVGVSDTTDGDVLVRFSSLRNQLWAARVPGDDRPCLLPVGVSPSKQVKTYVNWTEAGNLLVTSLPDAGGQAIFTSLVASLAARRRPDELQLVTLAGQRALPEVLAQLPHQRAGLIDVYDEAAVTRTLAEIRLELLRRMHLAQKEEGPSAHTSIALVVAELMDVRDTMALEMIAAEGPAHGIRVVGLSEQAGEVSGQLLARFETRLVLRTLDEIESIALLGQPDAAHLGGGGRLLLRSAGRRPVELRGFRVPDDHLAEFVELARDAFGPGEQPVVATQLVEVEVPADGAEAAQSESVPVADSPVEADVVEGPACDDEDASETKTQMPLAWAPPEDEQEAMPSEPDPPSEAEYEAPTVPAIRDMSLPLVTVHCFGSFQVLHDGREVEPVDKDGTQQFKAWEALMFLAAQPTASVHKEKVMAALWPDAKSSQATNSLWVAFARIRAILGEQVPGITAKVVRLDRTGMCHLDRKQVQCDVHDFVELCQQARQSRPAEATACYEAANALYRGELLANYSYEWLYDRATSGVCLFERYQEEHLALVRDLARLHFDQGNTERAIILYKALLAAEPTLEDIVRRLYCCYERLGDRNALMREHRHLQEALQKMFGADVEAEDGFEPEPEPETTALYERVLAKLGVGTAVARSA